MLRFYSNKDLAKRKAGQLKAAIDTHRPYWRHSSGIEFSIRDLYAATLGFKGHDDFQSFTPSACRSSAPPPVYWEDRFAISLERKWLEEIEASAIDDIRQLVTEVANANVHKYTVGSYEFEDIAYFDGSSWPILSIEQKLQDCLRTRRLTFTAKTLGEEQASSSHAGNTRVSAATGGLPPYSPAHQYQREVLFFAKKCIGLLGYNASRGCGFWTVELAYDLYETALNKGFWQPFFGKKNPTEFLDFVTRSLGFLDCESYQASQKKTKAIYIDSRPDSALSDAALRIRRKIREGYLFRYLSTLGLSTDALEDAYNTIQPLLTSDLYESRANRKKASFSLAKQMQGFEPPINSKVVQAMYILSSSINDDSRLSEADENAILQCLHNCPDGYRDEFTSLLKDAIRHWENASSPELDRAKRFLEAGLDFDDSSFTFLLAQHLLIYHRNDEACCHRAIDLFAKVGKKDKPAFDSLMKCCPDALKQALQQALPTNQASANPKKKRGGK